MSIPKTETIKQEVIIDHTHIITDKTAVQSKFFPLCYADKENKNSVTFQLFW